MADGTLPQGSAAYEKRGVAVFAPTWNAAACIQCNTCAFVCPHAAIRPNAMTAEEAANAPAAAKIVDTKPKPVYKFTMAISPLDCMGCTNCVKVCPVNQQVDKKAAAAGEKPDASKYALRMVASAGEADQQAVFDYAVANVSEKSELVGTSVKASQFKQPLLEFSGSCAGCA